ncbi:MAG: hypothetical protein CM1200mP28_05670 [Deltaproteobacteria bacterium]|nr:MAG: hypothetical protein CM1200mP28_05670 [Deltaproteobacteria bacterium]
MLVSITSVLILILAGWLWYESTKEEGNLSVMEMVKTWSYKSMTLVEVPAEL